MSYTPIEAWVPADGLKLPENALALATAQSSQAIIAGPGSGKTELLAQRAHFLLTTGKCLPSKRILALSFKVDAAKNLKDRVAKRCPARLTARFESLTLDAFAKRILDQFKDALPEALRPSADYTVSFGRTLNEMRNEFSFELDNTPLSIRDIQGADFFALMEAEVPSGQLDTNTGDVREIRWRWWSKLIQSDTSVLSFNMIKLLALKIIKDTPLIQSAIQSTYSHVFLDEAQDITYLQYSILKTTFKKSSAVVTAVGDNKQAIMGFAGANLTIFTDLENDFQAFASPLNINYRSNQAITDVINGISEYWGEDYIPAVCNRADAGSPHDAVVGWNFQSFEDEGGEIARFVARELAANPYLKPSDFAILCKTRSDRVEGAWSESFGESGLTLRNEARYVDRIQIQNLLSENAFILLLSALKVALNIRDGEPYQTLLTYIFLLNGGDVGSERDYHKARSAIQSLTADLDTCLSMQSPLVSDGQLIVDKVLEHFSKPLIRKAFQEYTSGTLLQDALSGFMVLFEECHSPCITWPEIIDEMVGVHTVRLMTVHKCKGLEFHSIVFTRMNDDSFFGSADDKNVFFVALSRAREKIRFTRQHGAQKENVAGFFRTLEGLGVEFTDKFETPF